MLYQIMVIIHVGKIVKFHIITNTRYNLISMVLKVLQENICVNHSIPFVSFSLSVQSSHLKLTWSSLRSVIKSETCGNTSASVSKVCTLEK